jgi:hypothetical protein
MVTNELEMIRNHYRLAKTAGGMTTDQRQLGA